MDARIIAAPRARVPFLNAQNISEAPRDDKSLSRRVRGIRCYCVSVEGGCTAFGSSADDAAAMA